jgi:hypothetical protein
MGTGPTRKHLPNASALHLLLLGLGTLLAASSVDTRSDHTAETSIVLRISVQVLKVRVDGRVQVVPLREPSSGLGHWDDLFERGAGILAFKTFDRVYQAAVAYQWKPCKKR